MTTLAVLPHIRRWGSIRLQHFLDDVADGCNARDQRQDRAHDREGNRREHPLPLSCVVTAR
jgi:hypothetical protein